MRGAERYCRDAQRQQAAVWRQRQLKAGSGVKQRHQLGSHRETELGLAGQQLGACIYGVDLRSRPAFSLVLAKWSLLSRCGALPVIHGKQHGGCTQGQSFLVASAQCRAARQHGGHSPSAPSTVAQELCCLLHSAAACSGAVRHGL